MVGSVVAPPVEICMHAPVCAQLLCWRVCVRGEGVTPPHDLLTRSFLRSVWALVRAVMPMC